MSSGTGIIQQANRAEFELLGYRPHEYIGRHIAEFHHDKEALACTLDELASGGRLDKRPAQPIRKDGSLKDVIVSSSGNFANGEFVNTRCVTIDVGETKNLSGSKGRISLITPSKPSNARVAVTSKR